MLEGTLLATIQQKFHLELVLGRPVKPLASVPLRPNTASE